MPTTTSPVTSPAAISRFQQCPRRFWFQDVQHVRAPEQRSAAAAIGNALHDTLARLFRLDPVVRSPDQAEQILRTVWRRHCPRALFDGDRDERDWGIRAITMLHDHLDRADLTVVPVAVEATLSGTVGPWRIRGRLDRIDPNPDRTVTVVDYKTGRARLHSDHLRTDPAARIYRILAHQHYGPVTEIRFEYLSNGTSATWRPEPDDLPHLAEAVRADLDGIHLRRDYPPNPGRHCDWCPFTDYCAEGWAQQLAA